MGEGIRIGGGGKKEGAYVWKKCLKETISITQTTTGVTPTLFQVTSDTVDVSTLTTLDGFSGKIISPSAMEYKFTDGKMYWGGQYWNYIFEPSTGVITAVNMGAGSVRVFDTGTRETFIDYVVSNTPIAYPDGGTLDGYWYEKSGSKCKTFSGTIKPTSSVKSISISNPFRSKEKVKVVFFTCATSSSGYIDTIYHNIITGFKLGCYNTGRTSVSNVIVTDNKITFNTGFDGVFFPNRDYTWEVSGDE